MSRNIEAVIGEPSAVSMPLMRWKNGPPGSWPAALATALHSSRMPSRKSLPPGAATIAPTGARIKLDDVLARHGAIDGCERLGDGANPIRLLAVALAEIQGLHRLQLHYLALLVERHRNRTESAEHPLASELLIERVEMGHAVEHRDDRGLRSHCWRKGFDRVVEVVGLAAQHHDIEIVLDGASLHRGRVLQGNVAVRAPDHEAGGRKFARALRPHQERDVTAGLQHPAAEISADGAGTDHENTHDGSPFLVVLRKRRIANGEWRIVLDCRAIRHSLFANRPITTFRRTGGFPFQTSRRFSAAGRVANRRPRRRPAASTGPDCPAPPCPRSGRGVRAPRRCR